MSATKKVEPTIKATRRHVFETMLKLSEGKVSIDEAFATNKLASTILNGYSIEKDMVQIAVKAQEAGIVYAAEPIAIEK